jgi:hypothetical protein
MTRRSLTALTLTTALSLSFPATAAFAHDGAGRPPAAYQLNGDAAGSRFEGIGVDTRGDTFYVSETTGGEIHRGHTHHAQTLEWKPEGADGRTTARGITTDRSGRVYIAGGPNGINTDRPDLWVYDADGTLLAAPRVGVANAFVNDVVIGPDGAAYFTNSNAPQVFRVAHEQGTWTISTWVDATGIIATQAGFNLGGIVVSPDRSALIVAQGNVGALWRVDLRSRAVRQVAVTGADLLNADGLVRRGNELTVVRNFSRRLTTLRLAHDGSNAEAIADIATDPTRVFTTAKFARGRLLLVDSKFEEQPAPSAPYEVVALERTR